MSSNKRKHTRIESRFAVKLISIDERGQPTHDVLAWVRDIGAGGLGVITAFKFELNSIFVIVIPQNVMPGLPRALFGVARSTRATRTEWNWLGIQFCQAPAGVTNAEWFLRETSPGATSRTGTAADAPLGTIAVSKPAA